MQLVKEGSEKTNTDIRGNEPQKAVVTLYKRNLLKIIRAQGKFASAYSAHNMISCINIVIEDDEITFTSTDGNRLLESKVSIINEGILEKCFLNIPSYLLTGICFNISSGDYVQLIMDNEQLEINDFDNNFSISLKGWFKDGIYPKYQSFFEQNFEQSHEIALNQRFIDDIASIISNERTGIIKLKMDAKNPLKPVLISTDNREIRQKAVVMPIQIREGKNV